MKNLNKQCMKIISTKNLIEYKMALKKMHQIVDNIISKEGNDTIWFLEHNPVYTVGYTTYNEFVRQYTNIIQNIPLIETDRGGKITFHGPGQRICYLMINLKRIYGSIEIKKFLNDIHNIIINSLKKFDITGLQDEKYPGVWIKNGNTFEKIAAVGMKIKRGVSYHGCAINITTDMDYFNKIIPCGIMDPNRNVTSVAKILKQPLPVDLLDNALKSELQKIFKKNSWQT